MIAEAPEFDPNGPGLPGRLFGMPFRESEAWLTILPVPWEVTVSYREGTAAAPRAILAASAQVDLFLKNIPDAWKLGISLQPLPEDIERENRQWRKLARTCRGPAPEHELPALQQKVNEACESLNIYVKTRSKQLLQSGKRVAVLGGDHSTALGLLQALPLLHDRFGILQIDAHPDLRKSYEGFRYSHASVMYNAMKLPAVSRLVQVGIRDWCEEEWQVIQRAHGRIRVFHDEDLREQLDRGTSWADLCKAIVDELPQQVYISFDIDGLEPALCPHTGTPVPGGLTFYQAHTLIRSVAASGRQIIGFDLCEVAPGAANDWDAVVGARILYLLCCYMGVSHKRLHLHPSTGG